MCSEICKLPVKKQLSEHITELENSKNDVFKIDFNNMSTYLGLFYAER